MPAQRRQKLDDMRLRARAPPPVGDASGVLLPLTMVGDGVLDAIYTVSVLVGTDGSQNLSLQVDTGSSDLWIASSTCSSPPCSQTNGRLYNPSQSRPTGKDFNIQFLRGRASGPIVWDQVEIGGYTVQNQAFAAADTVIDEDLTPEFSGLLGLALPTNSFISTQIPPSTGSTPDGATLLSNIFGISPVSAAPAARFLSLSLARPGSNRVPSFLGIGKHPPDVVNDPSAVRYTSIVGDQTGVFWKTTVEGITVWVDGQPKPVSLVSEIGNGAALEATLDTGVSVILTSSSVANGIYGALGIAPSSDGNYYIPCETPLNISIQLSGHDVIPLHPLDMTTPPAQDATSKSCIGLIQPADEKLSEPIGDMILGVAFMRNTYTVMAYDAPDARGRFNSGLSRSGPIMPRLGLLPLTDPTTALEEFRQVRVLKQPLSGQPPPRGSGAKKSTRIGIDVLIGVLSFLGLCLLLFAGRWFFVRRLRARGRTGDTKSRRIFTSLAITKPESKEKKTKKGKEPSAEPAEDQGPKKDRILVESTMSSGLTQVKGAEEKDGEVPHRDLGAGPPIVQNLNSSLQVGAGQLPPTENHTSKRDTPSEGQPQSSNIQGNGNNEFSPYKPPNPSSASQHPTSTELENGLGSSSTAEPNRSGAEASIPLLAPARGDSSGGHQEGPYDPPLASLPEDDPFASLPADDPFASAADLPRPIPPASSLAPSLTRPVAAASPPTFLVSPYVDAAVADYFPPLPPPPPPRPAAQSRAAVRSNEFGMPVETSNGGAEGEEEGVVLMTGIGTAMRGGRIDMLRQTGGVGGRVGSIIFLPETRPAGGPLRVGFADRVNPPADSVPGP